MKDALGEYGENEVPHGFELPLHLNMDNDAIGLPEGNLFAFWGVISEEVPRLLAKRKCEFMVKLANGELMMSKGRVYKKVGEQYQGGRMVVTFESVEEKDKDVVVANGEGSKVRNPWGRAGRPG